MSRRRRMKSGAHRRRMKVVRRGEQELMKVPVLPWWQEEIGMAVINTRCIRKLSLKTTT